VDSALSPSSVAEQPSFPFSQQYTSSISSTAAQDPPAGSSIPLSSSILAQHQHALPHHTPRHDGHPFSPLEDEGSVSTLGGDNNFFDFPGSPRSPSLTPQGQAHKRPDNASSTERLMLQDAFSSLSLADKCALSVSLGPHCLSGRKMSPSVSSGSWESNGGRSSSPSKGAKEALEKHTSEFLSTTVLNKPPLNPVKLEILTAFSYNSDRSDSMSEVYVSPKHAAFVQNRNASMGASSGVGTGPAADCNIESMGMQSVISQSDKVSLDVAMSMMGQQELDQVEDEVRKIQNNVRGWLLRKNYVNLRDAAKTLQVAWREKRSQNRLSGGGGGTGTGSHRQPIESENGQRLQSIPMAKIMDSSTSISRKSTRETVSMSISRSPSPSRSPPDNRSTSLSSSSYIRAPHDSIVLTGHSPTSTSTPPDSLMSSQRTLTAKNSFTSAADEREMHAAATLQAATRAMLARKKSFTHAKRQALASLVIQKSFLHWWVSKDPSNWLGDDTGRKRKDFM
jgi:IQ calmodulin-binding motif